MTLNRARQGARQDGLSTSDPVPYERDFLTEPFVGFTENGLKKKNQRVAIVRRKMPPQRGWRGQRKTDKLVWNCRKATTPNNHLSQTHVGVHTYIHIFILKNTHKHTFVVTKYSEDVPIMLLVSMQVHMEQSNYTKNSWLIIGWLRLCWHCADRQGYPLHLLTVFLSLWRPFVLFMPRPLTDSALSSFTCRARWQIKTPSTPCTRNSSNAWKHTCIHTCSHTRTLGVGGEGASHLPFSFFLPYYHRHTRPHTLSPTLRRATWAECCVEWGNVL